MTGRLIFDAIMKARDTYNLGARFAVLLDLTERASNLADSMKRDNPVQYAWMKKCNGNVDPVLTQYSHLEGINCILILCDKGKMGTLVGLLASFQ